MLGVVTMVPDEGTFCDTDIAASVDVASAVAMMVMRIMSILEWLVIAMVRVSSSPYIEY